MILLPSSLGLYKTGIYTTSATSYDGSTNFAQAIIDGICPDSTAGTISVFWETASNPTGRQMLSFGRFNIVFNVNRLQFTCSNSSGSSILNLLQTTASGNGSFHSLVLSVDTSVPRFKFVVDNTLLVSGSTVTVITSTHTTPAEIDYTQTANGGAKPAIGSTTSGGNKFLGCLSEVFFHDQFLDVSDTTNLRKLVTAGNHPADKGADGSTVFGAQPRLYMKDGRTNLGSTAGFTYTGTVTNCSLNP